MRTHLGHTAVAALLVPVLSASFIGCAQRQYPLAEAPRFPVPPAGTATSGIQPVSYEQAIAASTGGATTDVRVVLDDQRPDWERHFRSPAVAPSQHEHAIGFVPLESVDPAGQLESRVKSAIARTGLPAAGAEVTLRSFRVVVNDSEALAHDHDVLDRVRKNTRPTIGPFRVGFGASISSDPIDPTSTFANDLAQQRNGMFRPVLLRDGKRYLFGPPRELPVQLYPAGSTCEMDATVTLTGPHGSTKEFLVQVRQHVEPQDRTATVGPRELTEAISAAMNDFESRLAGRIGIDRRNRGL